MSTSDQRIRSELIKYSASLEGPSAENEIHWGRFRSNAPRIPAPSTGMLVFKPSGEKILLLGWRGEPSSEVFWELHHEPLVLRGKTADGRAVRVKSTWLLDSCRGYVDSPVHKYALQASEIVIGEEAVMATEGLFQLINYRLDAQSIRRFKTGEIRTYPASMQFKTPRYTIVLRNKSHQRPLQDSQELEHASVLHLVARRRTRVAQILEDGWRITRFLSLAQRQEVGWSYVRYRAGEKQWLVGEDRSFHGGKARSPLLCSPDTRKYLPRLIKRGLLTATEAQARYGFFLALRHFLDSVHSTHVVKTLTSLFQGFEACVSAFRRVARPKAVTDQDWKEAKKLIRELAKAEQPASGRRNAIERVLRQSRNEPSAKEALSMILKELRLQDDLAFWRLRQDVVHRGDLDRTQELRETAEELYKAQYLLAHMLLRMLGYSGMVHTYRDGWLEFQALP